MRRFNFIGRLGAADTSAIPVVQPDAVSIPIQFVNAFSRVDYGIGAALEKLKSLGLRPSERAIDLMILAAMITAADTRVSRAVNAQNGWTRELDLTVPVSDISIWQTQASLLSRTLRFLTGDHWRVFFRERPHGFDKMASEPTTMALTAIDEVCLLSGGLDSLIGATNLLESGRQPLFVSHYWDTETSKAQKAVLHHLGRKVAPRQLNSLRTRLGFDVNHVSTGEVENTLRGRSFLFFALAILAGSSLQRPVDVIVPENGLIGLNVPLDHLRLGALSTRTTHPFYMARINELVSNLGLSVKLVNPYRHKTKGEMVEECKDLAFLRSIVGDTMSCSSPAKARYKGMSPRHCGTCVPCLIRRASLQHGLGVVDPTLYGVPSLVAHTLDTRSAEGEHVRSFQFMVEKIASKPQAATALVRIPGPLNDEPGEIADYVDVFKRGIAEVGALLAPVNAKPS